MLNKILAYRSILLLLLCMLIARPITANDDTIPASLIYLSMNNFLDIAPPCQANIEDFSSMQPNSTFEVNCNYDLQLSSIALPTGAKLVFSGGSISNGSLIFNGGEIAGELLNHKLALNGDVQLISPIFEFSPHKWGIQQCSLIRQAAEDNRNRLNQALSLVHNLGGTEFKINEMDAYFEVSSYHINAEVQSQNAILVPSNMRLSMADKTFLRVLPNNAPTYNLLAIYRGENITISGGNLIGDRWSHDYTPVNDIFGVSRNSHEWGHVVKISGGKDVVIENMNITKATGDSLSIGNSENRNPNGTPGNAFITTNLIVRNNTITQGRRNNIGLTDGEGILFEDNQITDAASGESTSGGFSSAGTEPKFGITIKAYRVRENDGSLSEYEKVDDVVLKNNTFTGNYLGDINISNPTNVTIEDNNFDGAITNNAASDITIRNNIMRSRADRPASALLLSGIHLASESKTPDGDYLNQNYEVHGNLVEGYEHGITVASKGFHVYNNDIPNSLNAIRLGELVDSTLENNRVRSDIANGNGYNSNGGTISNVVIRNETIVVEGRPISLSMIQAGTIASNTHLQFIDGFYYSSTGQTSLIEDSENISFSGANLNLGAGVTVTNSQNIILP